MTTNTNINWLNGLLFVVIAAIILQLDAYFYLSGLYTIKPWKMVLIVFLLLGASQALTYGLPSLKKLAAQREVMLLLFCVFFYVLVQLTGVSRWTILPDETIIYLFWVYMLVLVLLGLMTGYELKDRRSDFFFLILLAHTLILLFDNIWGGISDSSLWARASGTLRNPNNAAFLAVALLAGSIRWYRDFPGMKEVLALVLTIAALGFTGSRGGAISFFVLLCIVSCWWILKTKLSQQRLKRIFIAITLISLIMAITMLVIYELRFVKRAHMIALQSPPVVNMQAQENPPVVNNDVVLNPSIDKVLDPNGRKAALEATLQLIKQRPWLGHGTGYVYTQKVGPHNMLLRVLLEVGVLGLLAYLLLSVGLLTVAWRRNDWGLAALTVCGFTAGLVSHNLTENRSYLVILGIMLCTSYSRRLTEQGAYNKG